jgi:hypothetical protein
MSGSSGSYTGDGPRNGDCNIVERTPLNSPKADVLKKLEKGDVLNVVLSDDKRSVLAVKTGVGVAGSLTPRRLADLLECMERGQAYKATVADLRGAFCQVEIRPK